MEMRVRRLICVGAVAMGIGKAALGCSVFHSYTDIVGEPVADAGSDEAAPAPSCTADLSSDRENCGACKHRCRGVACEHGVCQASMLQGNLPFPSCVVTDITGVYWGGSDAAGGITATGTQRPLHVSGDISACVLNSDAPWLRGEQFVYAGTKGLGTVLVTGNDFYSVAGTASAEDLTFARTNQPFVTDRGGGCILTCSPTNGCNNQAFDTLVCNLPSPYGVAGRGDVLFVTMQGDDTIRKIDAADGGVTTLVEHQSSPGRIAVDETGIYWANERNGTIMRANLDGSAATPLATDQNGPSGLTLDDTNVYWSNVGGGTVMKVAKSGGTPVTLAQGQDQAWDVAVDVDSVYWVTHVADGGVFRAPK